MDSVFVTAKHFQDKQETQVEVVDEFDKVITHSSQLGDVLPSFKRHITNKFLRGTGGAESKQKEYNTVTSYDAFAVAHTPYNQAYLAQIYDMSEYHHSAVDAKTANIVGLGYDLVYSPNVRYKLEDIDDEDKLAKVRKKLMRAKTMLMQELDDLNEDALLTQTWQKIETDYDAIGNGYLEIGRTVSGKIGYIGHIPAKNMRVRIQRDGFVQISGNKYTFFRNYRDKTTPDPINGDTNPNEVIHFKKYSPTDTYYGVPDIISASGAVAGNEFARRFNLDYFEHKAVPRYMITLKGASLDTSSEKKMLEFFETNLKGKNHRSMYLPLPSDTLNNKVEFSMQPVEAGIQEGSFDGYQKLNRDSILMAHRVPISKIGIPDGVSLAMARDADKTFKEQVCNQTQRVFEKRMTQVLSEFTDMFVFKFNELTLTDEDTQSRIDERYLRMQTITPNEVRERKGLPGLDSGDEPVQLTARAASSQTSQATGNDRRSQDRQANATDSAGEARNPKGEGRTQE